MSLWHAEIDQPKFVDGAKVTLLSDHRVVRVVTADTLSIETPTGHKFSGCQTASKIDPLSACNIDPLRA